jgi:hypothetical protein
MQNPDAVKRQNIYRIIGDLFSSQNAKIERMRQDYQKMLYSFEFSAFEHAVSGLQMKQDEKLVLDRNPVFGAPFLLLILSRVQSDSDKINEGEFFTVVKSIFERSSSDCYFQSLERFIIVIPDDQLADGLRNKLMVLCKTIMLETGIGVKISASMPHIGVESLEYAYEEARQSANASLFANEIPVTIYEKTDGLKTASTAPFAKYREISELILSGDRKRLAELFCFFKEQMNVGHQTLKQTELMLDNIASAIESAAKYFPNHSEPTLILQHNNFPQKQYVSWKRSP